MNDLHAGLFTPRAPLQQRGQDRFEAVLKESRKLLKEEGLSGFSIPAIAARLGFTRASIYNFFPTPESVLGELVRRDLHELEQRLIRGLAANPQRDWRELIRGSVLAATQFYEEDPVARLLILGTSLTDESYRALAVTVQHLGRASGQIMESVGLRLPREPVDVMTLAVELGTSCLRQSVLSHGHITPAYSDEAYQVMVRYLQPYIDQLARSGKP